MPTPASMWKCKWWRDGHMNDMQNCIEIQPELGVYVLGAIVPEDRERVIRHLASCDRCREEVAEMAVLPSLLRKLPIETALRLADDNPRPAEPEAVGGLDQRLIGHVVRRRRRQKWMAGALAVAAIAGWAVWLSFPRATPAVSATILRTERIDGLTVLTSAEGYTLYWFGPDTSTVSKCTGDCARSWPPVTGLAIAGPGVTGALGTITRPDGTIQATFDGHPLYAAVVDTAPGQDRGNGRQVSGGVWHAVLVSGRTSGSGY